MLDINFVPQVIKQCFNVAEELKKFSLTFKIDPNLIDFKILNIYTFLVHLDGKKELLNAHTMHYLEEDQYYNSGDFHFIQNFDIKIFPKNEHFDVALKISENCDEARLFFYQDDILRDDEEFFEKVLHLVENHLVLHRVILRKNIKRNAQIIEQIKQKIHHKTPYPLSIVVERASFTPSVQPYFVFVPKEEYKDYKQEFKHAYFAVNINDAILKYYQGVESKSGRDVFGKFVEGERGDIKDLDMPDFNKEDAVLEQQEDCVVIKSLVDAYVSYRESKILFFKEKTLDNVKTYNIPMLLGGVDKQISLEIMASDPSKDAIASGVVLEANVISIKGSIGSNVVLRAKNIDIEGQTHQNTKIFAHKAKILLHKGYLVADFAEVGSVDSGSIESEKIFVSYCNGGRLFGNEIKIAELENNNKITFNSKVHLQNISGEYNEIVFYSFISEKTKELAEVLKHKKEQLTEKGKVLFAKYQKMTNFTIKYQRTIDQIKSADDKMQAQMLQNKGIRDIFYRYNLALKESKRLKKELLEFESLLKNTSISMMQLDDEVLGAQVFCDGSWGVETQLCYQREYPKNMTKNLIVEKGFKGNYQLDKKTRDFIVF
ncbi:FapA family protein [Helicobacter anatolicus]|uniref:FapA family protein n=1 Tax=Helicobacter anatolicus TaxID=2905874 RepID=UPI001E611345|nr:FapA family protein [Helicobacter anatolicus]MCE3040133.1 FapA family protein [Helicobacter anatolicus]